METTTRLGLVLFLLSLGATCVIPRLQNSRWGRRLLATLAAVSFAAAACLLAGPWVVDGIKYAGWSWGVSFPGWELLVAAVVGLSLLVLAIWPARLLIRRIRSLLGRGADAFYRRLAAGLAEEMGRSQATEVVKREAEQAKRESRWRIKATQHASGNRNLERLAEESGGSLLPLVKELEAHDLSRVVEELEAGSAVALAKELEKSSIRRFGRKLLDGDQD